MKKHCPKSIHKGDKKESQYRRSLATTNGISTFYHISIDTEIKEFVALWEEIVEVLRNIDDEDQITWRWTSDREYTTSNTYNIQLTRN